MTLFYRVNWGHGWDRAPNFGDSSEFGVNGENTPKFSFSSDFGAWSQQWVQIREIKSSDPKHYRLGPTLSPLAGCGGLQASCSGGLRPRRSAASLKLGRYFTQNPPKSTDFHYISVNIGEGKNGIHQFQVKISAYTHLWLRGFAINIFLRDWIGCSSLHFKQTNMLYF